MRFTESHKCKSLEKHLDRNYFLAFDIQLLLFIEFYWLVELKPPRYKISFRNTEDVIFLVHNSEQGRYGKKTQTDSSTTLKS